MSPATETFCKLLDAYFDALMRGGTQSKIDEARIAIVDAFERSKSVPSRKSSNCDHCDTFGGEKTYANQACIPIKGRVICVDWCIHHIVAALNAGGVDTVASCCGHGKITGRIDLADGRVLMITTAKELKEKADALADAV